MTINSAQSPETGPGNRTLAPFGTTIFASMSALAAEHGAINLGQGVPDEDGPEDMREVAARSIVEGPNQYPPWMGLPELRQAVAEHHARFYGQPVSWQDQTMVTSGGTEALAASILGLVNPGESVIVLAPCYDAFIPLIRLAGAHPIVIDLEPPDWALPDKALAEAFAQGPKAIIINTPMNPCGKVFQGTELRRIAELAQRHDVLVICDEVYEHLVFSGARHVPMTTLPEMAERTLRIGSAGKSFSFTGWKVGYMVGGARLIDAAANAHQFLTFTTPPHLQKAVAYGLAKPDAYFAALSHTLEARRDQLRAGLDAMGLKPGRCDGTYFLSADIRTTGWRDGDIAFCETIVRDAKVAAIPMSVFFPEDGPDHFIRLCFSKDAPILDEALERLRRFIGA